MNREICRVFRVSGRLFRGGDAWRARQDAEIRSSIDEKSCVGAGSEQGSNRKRATMRLRADQLCAIYMAI